MQIELELLAPAKNKDIGIAAINCGADAVYIAGPKFGAREAAGNTLDDITELINYAHKFGSKVYMVLNTILFDNELEDAKNIINKAYKIGCDAIIIQDLSILEMVLPPIPLFASTQTNIRTVQQAKFLESLGFSRLILARELSLKQIEDIKKETSVPLESFIHGALCVSYSGQCYLSYKLTGRSANRGCCAQACRSNYTLIDSTGEVVKDKNNKPLAKDIPILSLKDLNLSNNIPNLIDAGITSFKIEGRLKNESYIKNIVFNYRKILDNFLSGNNKYCKASLGKCYNGFKPNPQATFNRGYTTLYITGERGDWQSGIGAKSLGEFIGWIEQIGVNKLGQFYFFYKSTGGNIISNGDGLCFITKTGNIIGTRANSCNGNMVTLTEKVKISKGLKIYRNLNFSFEKEIEKNSPIRRIDVNLFIKQFNNEYKIIVKVENNIEFVYNIKDIIEIANNEVLAKANIINQLSKNTNIYSFNVKDLQIKDIPFFTAATINKMRREIAAMIDDKIKAFVNERQIKEQQLYLSKRNLKRIFLNKDNITYLANCSNKKSETLYHSLGVKHIDSAYELKISNKVELMRTKYCIKYQLGLCPHYKDKKYNNYKNNLNTFSFKEPLFLINGNNKLELRFNCKECEMSIIG